MTDTVLTLITDAMADIGAIAIEETPSAAEAAAGLRALNNMMDMWNTESLMVYNITQNTFAYVATQPTYTMGTGGNFNAARPVKIEKAFNRIFPGAQNQADFEIYVTDNFTEYAEILAKGIRSSLPIVMYDDGNFPLKNLTFWPVPIDNTYVPVLWYWTPITSFAALTDNVTLPPGYKRAIQKNLSLEIAPSYGREPANTLISQATESKAQIKRINTDINTLNMPIGMPGAGRYLYTYQDFLSGA